MLIGVDAGGSKCVARLCDERGATIGEGRGGPANASTDPGGALDAILATCGEALRSAGLGQEAFGRVRAGMGVAGIDHLDPRLPVGWKLPFRSWRIDGDAATAQIGAFAGADGAVLIVGTGSVGFCLTTGRRTVIGGHGSNVSDEGSGAWIGREAVRRALWARDGRCAPTGLVAEVEARIGLLSDAAAWSRTATPAGYAALAPAVLDLAQRGDAAADDILADAAAHLSGMVRGLARSGATQLAVLGGLGAFFAPRLGDAGLTIVQPQGDALDGAIRLARVAQ